MKSLGQGDTINENIQDIRADAIIIPSIVAESNGLSISFVTLISQSLFPERERESESS